MICLCGSTRFKTEFKKKEKELSLRGNVVLSVACFYQIDEDPRIKENKELLDDIHLQKISMSDEIFVINKEGYIGESTTKEINYAKKMGKKVSYLECSE